MGRVINSKPRPLYPSGKKTANYCTGGLVEPRTVLDGYKNLAPTGIRSPDRPACSQVAIPIPANSYIFQTWRSRLHLQLLRNVGTSILWYSINHHGLNTRLMECSKTAFKSFAYELLLRSLAFTQKVKYDFYRLPFERSHSLYETIFLSVCIRVKFYLICRGKMGKQTSTYASGECRIFTLQIMGYFGPVNCITGRSQWLGGLRRRSAAASLLRLWVRILPGT